MRQETRARPRIADVAREAGVSKTAVSFAFNSPERLSSDTATRIRDIATSLGYRPHPVARMLTQGRTRTLGLLTPQALSVVFANPFFATFSQGVAVVAEEAGYALLFVSPVHGSLARAVNRATVDGFVAIGLADDHPEVEQIRRAGLPIVMVDSDAPFPEHPAVDVDDEGGARLAAEHLLALGHRDFLVIGVEPPTPGAQADSGGVVGRRLEGYREALAAAGIDLPDDHVVVGPASVEGGSACLAGAWEDGRRPTAILVMSDAMAIGAINAARCLGLRVPADISIVGFDDIELSRHVEPPLTTVHQPVRQKGEEACRLLLSAIARDDSSRPDHRRLETRLIVRGSSGPAPIGKEVAGGR